MSERHNPFCQMRRNRLVYETIGLASRREVEQAIPFARGFVEAIRLLVTGQPRLKPEDQ